MTQVVTTTRTAYVVAKRRLRVVHLGRAVRVERDELERFVATMRDTRDG